jgi:hypothetical protein
MAGESGKGRGTRVTLPMTCTSASLLVVAVHWYLALDARACAKSSTCEALPEEIIHNVLIITGPGNGAPPGFSEYKLHIVGDPIRPATYQVSVTWFSGPDC